MGNVPDRRAQYPAHSPRPSPPRALPAFPTPLPTLPPLNYPGKSAGNNTYLIVNKRLTPNYPRV